MSSPLVYGGFIYILGRSGGLIQCLDASTGEEVYKGRLPNAADFWASPWAYGGRVFCLDDAGTTHVIEPGKELKVVATNRLEDKFWASSAISDGMLILRGTAGGLYAVK